MYCFYLMLKKIKSSINILKKHGVKSFARTIVKKILPSNNPFLSWESRILFVCRPGSEKKIELSSVESSANMLPLEDMNSLVGINGITQQTINNVLSNDECCWTIQQQGKIIAYVWISSRKQQIRSDTGYIIPIDKQLGAYWWRDLYVLPQYRGKQLVQNLFFSWLKSFSNQRTASLFTEVSPDNIPSIKVHRRLGFVECGKLTMWCFLGLRLYTIKDVKGQHFTFNYNFRWLY